jgi:hypothetical protein
MSFLFNKSFRKNLNTSESDSFKFKEKDLHKYLSYYVYNYGFIHTKTISHEESSKSKFSQWQHPDVVGVYFPIGNWEEEIIEFSKHVNNTGIKLFSYEIKRELILIILENLSFRQYLILLGQVKVI